MVENCAIFYETGGEKTYLQLFKTKVKDSGQGRYSFGRGVNLFCTIFASFAKAPKEYQSKI